MISYKSNVLILCMITLLGCSQNYYSESEKYATLDIVKDVLADGVRQLSILNVNGMPLKSAFSPGRTYIDIECAEPGTDKAGEKVRLRETLYFYAEPGGDYSLKFFSRGYNYDPSHITYCRQGDLCHTGLDYTDASICNVVLMDNQSESIISARSNRQYRVLHP